jgi:hypothetical protein
VRFLAAKVRFEAAEAGSEGVKVKNDAAEIKNHSAKVGNEGVKLKNHRVKVRNNGAEVKNHPGKVESHAERIKKISFKAGFIRMDLECAFNTETQRHRDTAPFGRTYFYSCRTGA